MSYERLGSVAGYEERIWERIAFLGRYGNQPADMCMGLPVDHMRSLVSATAKLLKGEADALKRGQNG